MLVWPTSTNEAWPIRPMCRKDVPIRWTFELKR